MNQRPSQDTPTQYEIRIEGHFDDYWSAWFGGVTLIREDDGTTTLRRAADQAQLHGLLAKVRDLGTNLISVKTIDTQLTAAHETELPNASGDSPDRPTSVRRTREVLPSPC